MVGIPLPAVYYLSLTVIGCRLRCSQSLSASSQPICTAQRVDANTVVFAMVHQYVINDQTMASFRPFMKMTTLWVPGHDIRYS